MAESNPINQTWTTIWRRDGGRPNHANETSRYMLSVIWAIDLDANVASDRIADQSRFRWTRVL
jgi:hypothetical protein